MLFNQAPDTKEQIYAVLISIIISQNGTIFSTGKKVMRITKMRIPMLRKTTQTKKD